MHDNQNKIIGYVIMFIIIYYILSIIVPFLIWGLIGMIVLRVIEHHKGR